MDNNKQLILMREGNYNTTRLGRRVGIWNGWCNGMLFYKADYDLGKYNYLMSRKEIELKGLVIR